MYHAGRFFQLHIKVRVIYMKKRFILVVIGLVIVAIIGSVAIVTAGLGRDIIEEKEGIMCQLVDEETSEYMLTNVPTDYVFEIQGVESDSFSVTDIQGNDMDIRQERTKNEVKIYPPKSGYEEGEVYFLDLQKKGSFKNPDFGKAEKIVFCIAGEERKTVKYTEKVQKINRKKLQIDGEKIVAEGTFESGDILVSDANDDGIEEVYVLEDVTVDNGVTTAVQGETEPQNVYEKLDIFYFGHINLEKAKIDEEEFKGRLIETGFMDALTDSVYAGEDFDVEVEIKKGKEKYEFVAEIAIKDPREKGRQIKLSFGFKDDILVKVDEDTVVFDNTITITDAIEFSVKGEDKEKTEERISKALENYVAEDYVADKGKHEIPLVPIKIPIAGPVAVYVDIGLTLETEYSTEFNVGLETELVMKQGIIYDLNEKELNKVYGDITGDIDSHILVKGKLDALAGAFIEAGLEVPVVITVGMEALGGPYLEAEGCFAVEGIPNDIKTKGYYQTELGIMFEAKVTFKALWFDEKEIELVEKRKPFYEKSKYLKVKNVNLAEQYTNVEGGIQLGELIAIYENIINGEEEKGKIETYKVYLDDEEMRASNGKAITPIKEGNHDLKVEWRHKGQKFSYTKDIEIKNVDYSVLIGMSKREIEISFGTLDLLERLVIYDDERPGYWYYSPMLDLRIRFNSIDYYPDMNAIPCDAISGTVQQLFNIDEEMSVDDFRVKTDTPVPLGIGDDLPGYPEELLYRWTFGLDEKKYGYMKLGASGTYNGYFVRISKQSDNFNIYPDSLCTVEGY